MWKQAAILLALSSTGCTAAATVGMQGNHVPGDAATTCSSQCASIGMALGSVVLVSSYIGCVCSAKGAPAAPEAAAAAAGEIAVLLRRELQLRQAPSNQHMDF